MSSLTKERFGSFWVRNIGAVKQLKHAWMRTRDEQENQPGSQIDSEAKRSRKSALKHYHTALRSKSQPRIERAGSSTII